MIEPASKNNNARVVGYDNYANLERRSVMERSRDLDEAQITGIVHLVQEKNGEWSPGVIMYLPIFAPKLPKEELADRRRNVMGWLALSFLAKDFVAESLERQASVLGVEFFDGTAENRQAMLFDSTPNDDVPSLVKSVRNMRILDRDWTLVARPTSEFEKTVNHGRSRFVLAFGAVTTFTLTFFFWLLIRGRANMVAALEALKKSSQKLLKSETRYRALFEDSKVPMLVIDTSEGTILDANEEAVRYYGYPVEKLRGMLMTDINDVSQETVTERMLLVREGKLDRFESSHRIASGEIRTVEVSASKIEIDGSERILQIVTDITERKEAVKKILQMATHDELTGLPNRNLVMDRLSQAFAHADRSGRSVALLFLDLDRFKAVNDSIGHDIGDLLLKEVACRMCGVVRAEDTVARQGGDEFLIVLPDLADPSVASVVAEKLIAALSKPFDVAGHELHIGASIGIAAYPKDGRDGETLLKYGDIAMYRVKSSGRNSYRFFSSEMHDSSVEQLSLASALHRAVERQETSVEFQPLVNVSSGKIIGMEALLRWKHPEFGSVPPMKFIPIAEDFGLIVPIGEWVIRDVCKKIGEWKSKGLDVPRVAINLSARQFRLKSLVDDISRILKETGTDPRYIGLEITESMLVDDVEEAVETLGKLESLGIEVSIDDFGTGYSSLNYLKRFPVGKLKIDRSFVNDIVTDPDDVVIVKSIIDLAHNLGLRVVAEGVENEAQLDMLKKMGCDCVQGYFFSRPIPADDMEKRLSKSGRKSLFPEALTNDMA